MTPINSSHLLLFEKTKSNFRSTRNIPKKAAGGSEGNGDSCDGQGLLLRLVANDAGGMAYRFHAHLQAQDYRYPDLRPRDPLRS